MFKDERGTISEVCQNAHVLLIQSNKGAIRANHVHQTFGHICFVTRGSLTYFERKWKSNDPIIKRKYYPGDSFTTSAGDEHAMLFEDDGNNEFVCISFGARDQTSYEKDLIRLDYDLTKLCL